MAQIGFKSNKGVVRKNNEDACFVIPGSNVYIVADGVGGNNSGEVASRTAVENIAGYVNENDIRSNTTAEEIFSFMTNAIACANTAIFTMGSSVHRDFVYAPRSFTKPAESMGQPVQPWPGQPMLSPR